MHKILTTTRMCFINKINEVTFSLVLQVLDYKLNLKYTLNNTLNNTLPLS